MHDFVVDRLQQSKGQWSAISEKTGVPLRTIQKIASREIKNPGITHMEKLANNFDWQTTRGSGRNHRRPS